MARLAPIDRSRAARDLNSQVLFATRVDAADRNDYMYPPMMGLTHVADLTSVNCGICLM